MIREHLRAPWIRAGAAILKLVVVPVAIGWVVLSLTQRSLDVSVSLHAGWLVAAVVGYQLALWVVSLRLVQLLAVYQAPLPRGAALRINLRSMFYFLVIPTQAGMEAVRFFGLRSSAPGASNGAITATLLLDRVLGALAAALLFAVAALAVVPGRLPVTWRDFEIGVGPSILLFSILLVVAVVAARLVVRRVDAIAALVAPLRGASRQLVRILGYAVLAQALVVASVACALRGLGLEVPLVALTFGIMGGNFLMLIPISFAGLGPADVGGAALLIAAGIAQPAALMAAFVTYLARVFAGLQGAGIEIWSGGMALRAIVAPATDPSNSDATTARLDALLLDECAQQRDAPAA